MFEDVLEKIVPSNEDKAKASHVIKEFVSVIEESIRALSIKCEVFLGGSFAKDTWLKGDSDIDIFLRFDRRYEKISDLAEEVLKNTKLNYIRIKGSRDYFKVYFKNYEFEVVPVLKINKPEEAKNITDLSYFHVNWVKSKINETLANEIRLTKYFFKVNGIYGAESYIKGFSGYAVEILTIYYGSFLNLIKAASEWRPKVIIDPERHYKDVKELFKKLNPDRLKSPIVIVDPVYPIRNAAASVSMEKFSELIYSAKMFLRDLEEGKYRRWFEKRNINLNEEIKKAKENGLSLIYFEVKGKGESKDIANTKVLKFADFVKKQLEILGFKIFNQKIEFAKNVKDLSKIFIWIYPYELPKVEIRFGPPVWKEPNFTKFIEKWKNQEMFISSDGRIVALVKRRIKTLDEAINFVKEKFKENIKEKVEIIKIKTYK